MSRCQEVHCSTQSVKKNGVKPNQPNEFYDLSRKQKFFQRGRLDWNEHSKAGRHVKAKCKPLAVSSHTHTCTLVHLTNPPVRPANMSVRRRPVSPPEVHAVTAAGAPALHRPAGGAPAVRALQTHHSVVRPAPPLPPAAAAAAAAGQEQSVEEQL